MVFKVVISWVQAEIWKTVVWSQTEPTEEKPQVLLAHACHPSYCGKHKTEDRGPGQHRQKAKHCLQYYQNKKGYRHDSSGRAPT
jgi:hypothetical protein